MRTRRSLIGAALGALLFATLTFPTSAADLKGTLAFVNGIPGKRVDVCLNGREIKSGLAYGKGIFKNVIGTGDKNLKFYERDQRACRGTVLAKDRFAIGSGGGPSRSSPRGRRRRCFEFDNAELGEIPPLGTANGFAPYAWRNAADVDADFSYRVWGIRLMSPCRRRRDLHEGSTERQRWFGPEHGLPVPGHRRW